MTTSQSSSKLRFYRQCRLWHGYLSAFSFALLLFFAATGIALNHPRWFATTEARPAPIKLTLTTSQLQGLRASREPAESLTKILGKQTVLYGDYQDGEAESDRLFVRMRGARGSSDIRADLSDGSVIVRSERATTIGILNALHRGEQAGATWRIFIDLAAGVLIVLSLVGYAVFLSMSTRLKTALLLSGLSVLATLVLFFVTIR